MFEALDPFGDIAETGSVLLSVAAAFFVGDDGETLAEGGGERG